MYVLRFDSPFTTGSEEQFWPSCWRDWPALQPSLLHSLSVQKCTTCWSGDPQSLGKARNAADLSWCSSICNTTTYRQVPAPLHCWLPAPGGTSPPAPKPRHLSTFFFSRFYHPLRRQPPCISLAPTLSLFQELPAADLEFVQQVKP